jgi:hypothetical protein
MELTILGDYTFEKGEVMFYLEFILDSRGPKLATARKCNPY